MSNNFNELPDGHTMCSFPEYGTQGKVQCYLKATEYIELDIGDKEVDIPVCKYHGDTWLLMYGYVGLCKLIRDNKLFGVKYD